MRRERGIQRTGAIVRGLLFGLLVLLPLGALAYGLERAAHPVAANAVWIAMVLAVMAASQRVRR